MQRSAEACRLLVETNLTLKTIAARLGYADVVAFHRAFKTRTGFTPGQYRQRYGIIG
jgi:AraC-like DNA-binding protein